VLVSDFLLVHLPDSDSWATFRDVFEVDGSRVRDHEQRLVKLFVNPGATPTVRAADIADESARYNIGIVRTLNHPLLGFEIVHASQQDRFKFSSLSRDASAGQGVSSVEYREQATPSIISGDDGRDMPVHGRLWIKDDDGSIVRTEVLIDAAGLNASVTTRFEFDQTFAAAVPVEMREDYRRSNGVRTTGTATYGRFRSFQVDVSYGRGQQ